MSGLMLPSVQPYRQAMATYSHPTGMSFDEMMAWTYNLGFVFSTPDFFVCGRSVDSHVPTLAAQLDFDFAGWDAKRDAWYIHLAAGDLSKAWAILPYELPLIGFDRQGEVRFYPLEQVRRLTRQPSTN